MSDRGTSEHERVFAIRGPRRQARLRLQGSFFVVGRAEPFPVFHDDPMLSREHLAVVSRPDGVRVRDLGSRNGVLLNGERLARYAEVQLSPGDVLVAGQTELRLLTDAEREALGSAPGAALDEHAVDAEGRSRALRLDAVVAAAAAATQAPASSDDVAVDADETAHGDVDVDVDALPGDATSELDVPTLPTPSVTPPADDDPPTIGDLPTAVAEAPPPPGAEAGAEAGAEDTEASPTDAPPLVE